MAPPGYRELRTDHVVVILPRTSYLVLWGVDHLEWLQGQITNDVRLLSHHNWLDFCLTDPKGRLTAICRAWKDAHVERHILNALVVATTKPEALVSRIREAVILEDVQFEAY